MKRVINHIRSQPNHVRQLATIICTVVVVAVILVVWFNSFQRNLYTLLNPEEQTQDQALAQESKSLFSSMTEVLKDGRAQIFNIFSNKDNRAEIVNNESDDVDSDNKIHPLPVSGNR